MTTKLLSTRLPLVIAILVLAGCATTQPPKTTIQSSPANATIKVDQATQGAAPVQYAFDFSKKSEYNITAHLDGHFDKQIKVSKNNPGIAKKQINIDLEASQAWAATASSDATNQWLQIRVNPEFSSEHVWRRMVDSATARYLEIEQLNFESGYLRSAYVAKKFPSPKGEFYVRTRFIAAIASQNPLMYKVKVTAEWAFPGATWNPYNRVFKEDLAMVEDIRSRFGMM